MTDALKTAFRGALEEWHSRAWGTVPAVDFFTAALTRRGVVVQAEGRREVLENDVVIRAVLCPKCGRDCAAPEVQKFGVCYSNCWGELSATVAERDAGNSPGVAAGESPAPTPTASHEGGALTDVPARRVCAQCGTWRSTICGEGCSFGVRQIRGQAGFEIDPGAFPPRVTMGDA